jgi:hypothetical protein
MLGRDKKRHPLKEGMPFGLKRRQYRYYFFFK